jgi:hypothetical protein
MAPTALIETLDDCCTAVDLPSPAYDTQVEQLNRIYIVYLESSECGVESPNEVSNHRIQG